MRRLITALLTLVAVALSAQEQAPNRRDFTIVARNYTFTPSRIEVAKDDLVRVTLRSEDQPHSFAIDAYRLIKRVPGGQSITFEFRADQAGEFPFYCNLSSDERCREMKGTLVVRPR